MLTESVQYQCEKCCTSLVGFKEALMHMKTAHTVDASTQYELVEEEPFLDAQKEESFTTESDVKEPTEEKCDLKGNNIMHEGFRYRVHQKVRNRITYRCAQYRISVRNDRKMIVCRARVSTDLQGGDLRPNHHQHTCHLFESQRHNSWLAWRQYPPTVQHKDRTYTRPHAADRNRLRYSCEHFTNTKCRAVLYVSKENPNTKTLGNAAHTCCPGDTNTLIERRSNYGRPKIPYAIV